ncbi:hypothetical protein BHM03_00003627 [Ensete ventricosum]|uniref:30S ribosomal protein S6 n=1 Tax=Ensete ventricosum TaxID=4639 RepID=A0A445MA17_ENSVE|nr:hypothetical protein BHM03_00003627 [Ensete ventricosum]
MSSSVAQRTLFFQSPRSHGFSSRRHSSSASDAFQTNSPVDGRNGRGLVATGAKKRNKKTDSHSFAPRPDESTGPFPEAVLLKKIWPMTVGMSCACLDLSVDLVLCKVSNFELYQHTELSSVCCEYEGSLVILQPSISLREKKGRIWRLNNWGLRRLAYKIKKATHANYVLMNFELDAKFINDFKSLLDKDERIIRHLVMKRDEAITEDRPPPPEFHTLRAQQGAVDEDFDSEGEVEEEAWGDDEMELEMAGQDDFDNEADANIIIVDVDNENDRDDGTGRRAKILKYEGIKVVS